jgi:hypothetical protein
MGLMHMIMAMCMIVMSIMMRMTMSGALAKEGHEHQTP